MEKTVGSGKSDGSSADYYKLPTGVTQLQHLISHRDMNAQIGEIFRACYRYGLVSHSNRLRDAKKMKFYAEAEIKRLEKLLASEKSEKEVDSPGHQVWKSAEARMEVVGQNGNTGEHYDYLDPAKIDVRDCSQDLLDHYFSLLEGLPSWVQYICTDSDGLVKCHEEQPVLNTLSRIWVSPLGTRVIFMGKVPQGTRFAWEKSCSRVFDLITLHSFTRGLAAKPKDPEHPNHPLNGTFQNMVPTPIEDKKNG